jgi:hypothetical protein
MRAIARYSPFTEGQPALQNYAARDWWGIPLSSLPAQVRARGDILDSFQHPERLDQGLSRKKVEPLTADDIGTAAQRVEPPAKQMCPKAMVGVLAFAAFLIFAQIFMVAPILPVPAYLLPHGLLTLAWGAISTVQIRAT